MIMLSCQVDMGSQVCHNSEWRGENAGLLNRTVEKKRLVLQFWGE
jgi:hypothetical protein